jgi:hypothetical protein
VAFRFCAKQYTQGVTGSNGGGFGGPAATPPYERALRAPFLCSPYVALSCGLLAVRRPTDGAELTLGPNESTSFVCQSRCERWTCVTCLRNLLSLLLLSDASRRWNALGGLRRLHPKCDCARRAASEAPRFLSFVCVGPPSGICALFPKHIRHSRARSAVQATEINCHRCRGRRRSPSRQKLAFAIRSKTL